MANGQVYLLRKARLRVGVDSLAIAARRWAREHGYGLTTRSEFDERQEGRPKGVPKPRAREHRHPNLRRRPATDERSHDHG